MLDVIGFDPLSSTADTILARARNMPQHVNACEWADVFIKDEFKYDDLLFSEQNARFLFKVIKRTSGLGFQSRNGIRMIITTFIRSTL